MSLLELPAKHTHTIVIPFAGEGNEEEAYKKLEMYFSNQYAECRNGSGGGVSRVTVYFVLYGQIF